MAVERNNNQRNIQSLHDECERLLNYHVVLRMKDGSRLDGIIETVEPDRVIVLVGEDVIVQDGESSCNQQRQFGSPRRFRRFRRRALPLAVLLGLSLLSYPYSTSPYPYYPYYPY